MLRRQPYGTAPDDYLAIRQIRDDTGYDRLEVAIGNRNGTFVSDVSDERVGGAQIDADGPRVRFRIEYFKQSHSRRQFVFDRNNVVEQAPIEPELPHLAQERATLAAREAARQVTLHRPDSGLDGLG